jgi:hypothetical protein
VGDLENSFAKSGVESSTRDSNGAESISLAEKIRLEQTKTFQKDDLLSGAAKSNPLNDFVSGAIDGAVYRPARALKQTVAGTEQSTKPADKLETGFAAGQIVGSIVPFVGLAVLTRGATNAVIGRSAENKVLRVAGEQAAAGFVLGSALTPTELKSGESLFQTRMKQGLTDAATFGSMAATANLLGSKFGVGYAGDLLPTVGKRLMIGGAAGATGGFVDAEIRHGFAPTTEQLVTSMASYAIFGSLMESGGTLLARKFAASSLPLDRANSIQSESGRELLQPSTKMLLAQDANTRIVSNFSGWYDKLLKSVREATPGQTIVVAEEKWLKEGQLMMRNAGRTDISIIHDKALAEASAGLGLKEASGKTAKIDSSAVAKTTKLDGAALSKAIESEVLRTGLDPTDALIAELKRNRVLMIGEYHSPDNPHRAFGAELMPKLKAAGATHLAIEHAAQHKGKIFDAAGEINRNQFSMIMGQPEYFRMLHSARRSGLDIVPIDAPDKILAPTVKRIEKQYAGLDPGDIGHKVTEATLTARNEHMAMEINRILKDPNAKVVFWVGNYHLNTTQLAGEGPQVAKILRNQGIPTSSFASQHDGYWSNEPMRSIYTPLETRAIPIKDAPVIASQTMQTPKEPGHDQLFFKQYDYLIMYPKKGYHYD